jgi:hypothetical protein
MLGLKDGAVAAGAFAAVGAVDSPQAVNKTVRLAATKRGARMRMMEVDDKRWCTEFSTNGTGVSPWALYFLNEF